MAVAALCNRGRGSASLWFTLLLLLTAHGNGLAQAAPAKATATVASTPAATSNTTTTATITTAATAQQLQLGVEHDTPILPATSTQQYVRAAPTTTAAATAATPAITTTTTAATTTTNAPTAATTTVAVDTNNSSTALPATMPASSNIFHPLESVVQLLDLELTAAPPINKGHDGLKLTKKKQLQQQHFHTTTTSTPATVAEEAATPTTTTTTIHSTAESSQAPALMPVPNGYLGPIFMGEKIFSVVHPLKKPQPTNHQEDTIEWRLREGRIVEILAPTALLESSSSTSTTSTTSRTTTTSTTNRPTVPQTHPVLSTTVFQVPEQQTSTTRLPLPAAEISVAAPPRTESKISDIQIEVYDSTMDSIVASTNFRDNKGYYPLPMEPTLGTTKPPSVPVVQERFTQYVIDRADVSTQPAEPGVGKPEPAAIEIHINVSEAFGNESEDLEFSYRQPPSGDTKPGKTNDEVLVVEIIDSSAADNSTENVSSSVSSEHLNPMFSYPYRSDGLAAEPPAVRPPQTQETDELFMADRSGTLPRPPHPPPPPPMPRKPTIDRDSDTIFYISNTEVKVGESLPTASSGVNEQQRKQQLENQFFPVSYVMEQQRSSSVTPRYEEDIILSPLHNTADALKILRSPSGGGDGAPPLDVTYVGESVIEVEQQSVPLSGSSTLSPLGAVSSPQPDIIIQPAVLPDLAIGVPVIGELPPQIELKEIDYMPGELLGQSQGIYENDIESNSLGMGNDPDVIESSIQYGGDLIDDGAGGGFDGVEGSYPFDSPAHRLQQQPQHGHRFSHLHREQQPVAELINATLQQRNDSTTDLGGASAMAPLQHGGQQYRVYSTKPDSHWAADYFNLIAVSVGLIVVILAAGLLTSMYCAVRYFLNKNATSSAAGDDTEQGKGQGQGQGQDGKHESLSIGSNSIGATSSSSSPASQLNNPEELSSNPNSTSNSNINSNPKAALMRSMSLALASGVQRIEFQFEPRSDLPNSPNAATSATNTPTFPGAFAFSGSVTKMTLKDNHLIVVTEERHDISRNARETKMHTDKDGVFVVEVARGIDSKQPPDSPAPGADITELPFDTNTKQAATLEDRTLPPSHEQVQIHAPPSDFANPLPAAVAVGTGAAAGGGLHLIEEEQLADDEILPEPQPLQSAATGLSQSDLSSTSSSDSNKRYSYGNQELYVINQPGYVTNAPPVISIPLLANEELIEQEPQEEKRAEKQPEKCLEKPSEETSVKPLEKPSEETSVKPLEKPLEETSVKISEKPSEEPSVQRSEKEELSVKPLEEPSEKVSEKLPEIKSDLQVKELEVQSPPVEETPLPAPAAFENQQENELKLKTEAESQEVTKTEAAEQSHVEPEKNNQPQTKEETQPEPKAAVDITPEVQTEQKEEEEKFPEPKVEVCEESQLNLEPENNYDSLMSLPAPPSTEEIKEFNDFTLMESNQLDSLPPPPPPLTMTDNGHNHSDKEIEAMSDKMEAKTEPLLSNGNGKLQAATGAAANGVGGAEEPATLTPPASPPASPTAAASLCGGGGLSNGIHAVAVNGS